MESDLERPDLEVLDAFVDGEPVNTAALKTALARPEGRDYFVDAWLLRETVREDAPRLDLPTMESSPARVPVRSPRRPGYGLLVAASLVASLTGGYAIGNYNRDETHAAVTLLKPIAQPTPAQSYPVPAPTRIIQLEFHQAPGTTGGN